MTELPEPRLSIIRYGGSRPAADNSTFEGRAVKRWAVKRRFESLVVDLDI